MGKPTGFLEYQRKEPRKRSIAGHIHDYREMGGVYGTAELQRQAARCMDCGVPFCHSGIQLEGASVGCPLGNLIPEINDLVYRGKYAQAYERLRMTHPFPEFTGRVCPSLCEGSCTLGEHGDAVAIKEIEHFLDAYASDTGLIQYATPRAAHTGRRVAVIGSGPAGLAAADYLNRMGETVVVLERADRPGGLLTYGIPAMKLDKAVVQASVERLEAAGVEFRCNCDVGKSLSVDELYDSFDAVIVATGAPVPRMPERLPKGIKGVFPAMSYLSYATKILLDPNLPRASTLEATGRNVIVVGNGDTATDCVATAVRQGAKSITQLYYRDQPNERRSASNPWPLYPRILRSTYGQDEARAVYGHDPREYRKDILEVTADATGRVCQVSVGSTVWEADALGNSSLRIATDTVELRPCELLLYATGFKGADRQLLDLLGLEYDTRGNAVVVEGSRQTSSRKGVFVAGDVHRGASLVVWALKEGRDAALECHHYLVERALLDRDFSK